MGLFDFDNKKREKGLLDDLFDSSSKYRPDAWRKDIPYEDKWEPHPYDRPWSDRDNDGYSDGFMEDGDM